MTRAVRPSERDGSRSVGRTQEGITRSDLVATRWLVGPTGSSLVSRLSHSASSSYCSRIARGWMRRSVIGW